MAEPPPAASGNACPACGFVNAPNRLYCEDCGAKLGIAPPSYLAATTPENSDPASGIPAAAKPRILTTRRENRFLQRLFGALRLLVYLLLLATVVALLWPPANLPPPAPPMDAATIGEIRTRLAAVAQQGSTVDAPWERLNSYLASVLVPAGGGGVLPSSFVRAILQPRPGGFRFVVEKKALGIPVFMGVDYRLLVQSGALTLVPTGAQIGRVPLPASAAPFLETFGGRPAAALGPDLEVLRRARVVRLSPTGVNIGFGARRP